MTNVPTKESVEERAANEGSPWYAQSVQNVAAAFGVDTAVGLSSTRAVQLLDEYGPNSLPEEKPKPGWRRFPDQYTSYMQIILVGAAAVSLAVKQWVTAVFLLALTVLNAIVGLREEGKAESAMNALKSMTKATVRGDANGVSA